MKNLLLKQTLLHLPIKPFLLLSLSVVPIACQSTDLYRFERQFIDDEFVGAYDLSLADIDGDGLIDIVAVANEPAQFVWYQNPSWNKHRISSTASGNIATAPYDIDGDGDTDLVLASEFNMDAGAQVGLLQWFENPGNPREAQQWPTHTIDRASASRSVQWVDVVGNARKVLVSLAVDNAPLLAYPIPRNPTARWQSVELADPVGVAHDLSVSDFNEDDKDELLIASSSGIDMLQFATEEQSILISRVGEGDDAGLSVQGSAQAALGRFSHGQQFVASIEAASANEVVIYTPASGNNMSWERTVIDDSLQQAHVLKLVDINNDGVDEIVVGSDAIYTYRFNMQSEQWQKESLGQISTTVTHIAAGDINGDGRSDIVAIGTANAGVVLLQSAQ